MAEIQKETVGAQDQIRVIIADDHGMVRDGIARLLSDHEDIHIVGVAQDGRKAIDLVHAESPDVVVMDVGMPGLNGVDATKRITDEYPDVKVVAISMNSDHDLASDIMRAGARAFIVKDCAVDELAKAIREVVAGETYMCKKIMGTMVESMISDKPGAERISIKLSSREREVLQLTAEGLSTRDMAEQMKVSTKTVESHRRQLMNKLNIHNIANLTRYALKQGITSLDY